MTLARGGRRWRAPRRRRGGELVAEAAAGLVDQHRALAAQCLGQQRDLVGDAPGPLGDPVASAVGWNCTNSRSASEAPARAAIATPSPTASAGVVVTAQRWA